MKHMHSQKSHIKCYRDKNDNGNKASCDFFHKKLKYNTRVLKALCHHEILPVATKHDINCLDMSVNIKNCEQQTSTDIYVGFKCVLVHSCVHVFLFVVTSTKLRVLCDALT